MNASGNTSEHPELTFEQCQQIDKYLEEYSANPSNSNKYRIGLHAYINEILAGEHVTSNPRHSDFSEVPGGVRVGEKMPQSAGDIDVPTKNVPFEAA